MKTLGSIVTYRKGKPPKVADAGSLPVLSPHYLRTGQVEDLATPSAKDVVLTGGEIVLLWDGSNAGEFLRARAGVLSSTMVVFEFDESETDADYLFYDLKRFEPELKGRTAGSGIPHVDKEVLLGRKILEGTPDKQQATAKVLLKIDRAIEQTEALLAKQQRIKTGLMHDLLTRGLDSQGHLRDPSTHRFKKSPLGMIPEEWEVKKVGELAHVIDPNPSHRYPPPSDTGVPIASTENFVGDDDYDLSFSTLVPNTVFDKQMKRCGYEADVVIFARKGKMGFARPYGREPKIFSHTVVAVKPKLDDVINRFLLWTLRSARFFDELHLQMNSNSGVPTLGINFIEGLRMLKPLKGEQAMIVQVLDKHSQLLKNTEIDVRKLRRLKAGLMHDLLSGRVPVTPLLAKKKRSD